jgi:TATA-binding protein-associated factor
VTAFHRLILSGTPIQNNVLELWSLFDFLMPGLLGTEKEFNDLYSKPILASKDSKSTGKEQERAALAIEALHKQVLPFILRRMKEDVLDDLPPKIIQDYYCEMSELQIALYKEYGQKNAASDSEDPEKRTHIFQNLQYLRKVCNHPLLVRSPENQDEIKLQICGEESSLHDIRHAPKLLALKDLLTQCGIAFKAEDVAVSPHRALIFVQLKAMLDIIEQDLFQKHIPGLSWLRMDGSTSLDARHDIVTQFNNDPSIDILLVRFS